MPAYFKGNAPPVTPSKSKAFIERRVGPHDRRVADRRVANLVDRRISVSANGEYPSKGALTADRKDEVPVKARHSDHAAAPAQQPSVERATAAGNAIKSKRHPPIVVDAVDVDKARRVYSVKPEVFMDIVDRLNLSMVIHYQKRRGMNVYFIQFEGGVVETETPNRLSMLDASEQDMEKPSVSDMPANASRTGTTAVAAPPENGGAKIEIQNRPGPKEKVMASRKKRSLMEYHTEEGYYVTEWWNSPDDPALSVARIRIEPGATPSSYVLHGVTERFLFLTGRGIVEIDDKQYEVGAGDGLLIKAGARRRVTNLGDRDLGFLAICRPRFSRLSDEPMQNKFVKQA